MTASERETEIAEIAEQIGELARDKNVTVAVAESLTSGRISQALGAAQDSGEWFAGGVVAYRSSTKYALLDVPIGPVVTAGCAEQMSRGVLLATEAAVSVSVTGVGGPGPEEGHPEGTVFIGVSSPSTTRSYAYTFSGQPSDVVSLTTLHALRHLKTVLAEL